MARLTSWRFEATSRSRGPHSFPRSSPTSANWSRNGNSSLISPSPISLFGSHSEVMPGVGRVVTWRSLTSDRLPQLRSSATIPSVVRSLGVHVHVSIKRSLRVRSSVTTRKRRSEITWSGRRRYQSTSRIMSLPSSHGCATSRRCARHRSSS